MIAVSGDKYVEQVHRENVGVGLTNVSTYQTIEIDPRTARLTYRAWTEEGRVVNAFTIDQCRQPGRIPPETEAGPGIANRPATDDSASLPPCRSPT